MSPSSDQRVAEFYAQTYDESVPDWPGEIEFYRGLASEVRNKGQGLLEIACGTGRVAIRLAQEGTRTVGLDLSSKMLEVAREKSKGIAGISWVQADMCCIRPGRDCSVWCSSLVMRSRISTHRRSRLPAWSVSTATSIPVGSLWYISTTRMSRISLVGEPGRWKGRRF